MHWLSFQLKTTHTSNYSDIDFNILYNCTLYTIRSITHVDLHLISIQFQYPKLTNPNAICSTFESNRFNLILPLSIRNTIQMQNVRTELKTILSQFNYIFNMKSYRLVCHLFKQKSHYFQNKNVIYICIQYLYPSCAFAHAPSSIYHKLIKEKWIQIVTVKNEIKCFSN